MKRENQESSDGGGKGKMMEMEDQPDAGVDELLAALGYKVRSSEMADVAQKLEQLENAMGSSAANDDALLAHLADDTNHYNPSDLSGWLESMLSEINIPPPPLPQPQHLNNNFDFGNLTECSTITTIDFPPANFKPITSTLSEQTETAVSRKRMRTSSSSSCSVTMGSMPVSMEVSSMLAPVAADTQAAGIRLVQLLMACAEAVQQENLDAAMVLVNQIPTLAASQGGAMRKVAGFFADALLRRIYRQLPQPDCSVDSAFTDILHMHFYESCPYLKFAHFTANQAILEAFAGCRRVHVIDFAMKQGMQWPALMQALALRPGGPPSFRLTGIGPPQADNTDALQQVGHNLAKLAHAIHVDFEYRGFVANSLADLEPYMLESPAPPAGEEPEVIAVNSVFELHRLLARPSGIGKVLAMVRALRPRIMTVVEQEANHNAVDFIDRFTEALHYYSTMFDSLEGDGGDAAAPEQLNDRMMSDVYLGRQIMNVIGCEGAERTERHETLAQWRGRLTRAGFDPVHLGSNAFKQASTLLALFAGSEGYKVEEKATMRALIQQEYRAMYSQDLIDRVNSELSGNCKKAVKLWIHDPVGRDATILNLALHGDIIDLASVTEIICSRTPSQIQMIKQAYWAKFHSHIEHEIGHHATGDHKKMLLAYIGKPRYEGPEVDPATVAHDAKHLYKAGEKRVGTDEETFVCIFSERSRAHLAAVASAYHHTYGNSLEKAIKRETSGLFLSSLLAILRCAENPAKYFAKELRRSMKGLGTNDVALIRIVVTRTEIDMQYIKMEYQKKYKKPLSAAIHSETSGNYQKFLLALVGPNH